VIVRCLETYGMAVINDFLGADSEAVLEEVINCPKITSGNKYLCTIELT